jgi:hypothetical protein
MSRSPLSVTDRLTGVEQLPKPFRRHTADRGPTEAHQRIDHHRRGQARREDATCIALAGRVELNFLEEPVGVVGKQELLALSG